MFALPLPKVLSLISVGCHGYSIMVCVYCVVLFVFRGSGTETGNVGMNVCNPSKLQYHLHCRRAISGADTHLCNPLRFREDMCVRLQEYIPGENIECLPTLPYSAYSAVLIVT